MNKKTIYWICQVVGWSFFVLLNTLLLKLDDSFNINVAKSLAILLVSGILLSHLYRNLIIRSGWLRLSNMQLIPRALISILMFAMLMELLQFVLEWMIGIADSERYSASSIIYNLVVLSLLFFFWSIIYFLVHFIENYKKAEIENFKWQASINEIELNKLKSQLNPH